MSPGSPAATSPSGLRWSSGRPLRRPPARCRIRSSPPASALKSADGRRRPAPGPGHDEHHHRNRADAVARRDPGVVSPRRRTPGSRATTTARCSPSPPPGHAPPGHAGRFRLRGRAGGVGADGKTVYFVANTGLRTQLFAVPAAGGTRARSPAATNRRRVAPFRGAGRARLRARRADERRRPPGASRGRPAARVTRVFDDLATRFRLPRVEAVTGPGRMAPPRGTALLPAGPRRRDAGASRRARRTAVRRRRIGSASAPGAATRRARRARLCVFKPNYRGSTATAIRSCATCRALLQERAPRRHGRRRRADRPRFADPDR